MPPRLVTLLILVAWTASFGSLLVREIIPGLIVASPPTFRTLARSTDASPPVRWSLMIRDESGEPRSIGYAVTETRIEEDGSRRLRSEVQADADRILAGMLGGRFRGARSNGTLSTVVLTGSFRIGPDGGLRTFRAALRTPELIEPLIRIRGQVEEEGLVVETRADVPLPTPERIVVPYDSDQIIQNSFSPLERIPGLQVGMTWESQVVSPLTGGVQAVEVEVTDRELILWRDDQFMAFRVESRMSPFTMTTWVREGDGLVLRQEVPTLLGPRVILERGDEVAGAPDDAFAYPEPD